MGETTEKFEFNKTKGQKIKVYCSQCSLSTNHEVVQSVDVEGNQDISFHDNDYGIEWTTTYQIIKCQGCDLITFRQLDWCSENMHQIGENEWDKGETEQRYPECSVTTRVEKKFSSLPRLLREIYCESLNCYNDNLRILCAAGLRAIIEGICSSQNIKDGPVFKEDGITPALHKDGITPVRSKKLDGKIAGLHEKGILTKASADILHEYRFLGNEAMHELHLPTKEVLGLAMDIIEHMLNDLYDIPDKAEDLRQKRAKQLK